jgi:hypothetical protein
MKQLLNVLVRFKKLKKNRRTHYYRSTHFFALNSRQELHKYYNLFPVLFSRNNLSLGALAQA